MSDATIFYICGGVLAAMAVITSFIGLKSQKFPGKMGPAIILVFLAVVGVSMTFAVLNGQEEEEARAAENEAAGIEFEKEEEDSTPAEEGGAEAPSPEPGAAKPEPEAAKQTGPATILKLAASPTALAFDTTKLGSAAGEVTIDFDNPAALEHNVAIEKDGKEIATSATISEGKASVTADLAAGTYTFLCTVPGHAEAGMEGTLTVK